MASRATAGGATRTGRGRSGGACGLTAAVFADKPAGGHQSVDVGPFAFGACFRGFPAQNKIFKRLLAILAFVFIDWHFSNLVLKVLSPRNKTVPKKHIEKTQFPVLGAEIINIFFENATRNS